MGPRLLLLMRTCSGLNYSSHACQGILQAHHSGPCTHASGASITWRSVTREALFAGTMNQQAIVQRGVKDMLENVKFCQEHEIRPARFAEHASTASDFFFQVNAFREAEETLDGAIQVRAALCAYALHCPAIGDHAAR